MLTQKNSSALMGPVVIAWSGRDKEAHSLISIKVIAFGENVGGPEGNGFI